MAAERPHLVPPSQELFSEKYYRRYIYYTMVVTVFLLFCTVLSFTWGPRCILCVWIVIYQEFCEILWRVFVLVLLYLGSCIFTLFFLWSFYFQVTLSRSLTYSFLCPSIFQLQLASIITCSTSWILWKEEGKRRQLIFTKTYYRKRRWRYLIRWPYFSVGIFREMVIWR